MIGWFAVSFGLFGWATLSKKQETRTTGLILLCGWLLLSVGLLLLGGPESIRD